jgi:hypothetical protein
MKTFLTHVSPSLIACGLRASLRAPEGRCPPRGDRCHPNSVPGPANTVTTSSPAQPMTLPGRCPSHCILGGLQAQAAQHFLKAFVVGGGCKVSPPFMDEG